MTQTAIIQVKPGIGDVMWHLPFIKAVAATTPERQVCLLAPPTTHAGELLAAEACIARTIYFEHGGSELRRGINLIRLVSLLRAERFHSVWIFDRTIRPALAAWLARIPERIGIGLGPQRLYLTNPGIDRRHFHAMPTGWLKALMAAMAVPLTTTEPQLTLPQATARAIGERYAQEGRPWIVIGIGASHPSKDWSDGRWEEFLAGLRRATTGTVFLIGGPANAARAERMIAQSSGAPAVNACGLTVVEAAALLQHADLFVGSDSGPLNLAAAVGTPGFGLFGATPVLDHSRFIRPILPDNGGGPAPGGMARISPANVLTRIEAALASRKP